MSDAWEEIQAVKSKRNSLREKLEKRKKERQNILGAALGAGDVRADSPGGVGSPTPASTSKTEQEATEPASNCEEHNAPPRVSLERRLLEVLSDLQLALPATARQLLPGVSVHEQPVVADLLRKFHTQKLIVIRDRAGAVGDVSTECGRIRDRAGTVGDVSTECGSVEVVTAESVRLAAVLAALLEETTPLPTAKRKGVDTSEDSGSKVPKLGSDDKKAAKKDDTDIMSLLAMPSSREKAVKRVGEEILDLLSKPTAKERSLADKFKSQGGAQVMEFCPHGTRGECIRVSEKEGQRYICKKLHFRKIIQGHTDESLGDCSFLNTCFHMDSCKYVHYEVDNTDPYAGSKPSAELLPKSNNGSSVMCNPEVLTLHPPQWVQCDLRYLDMAFLGKFAVIMADPPWDIHMELPYGTMSDDEMRRLGVPQLQEHGLIFLWVTGRAMELGRECLKLWGYNRVDELIWVKTNQLQRIIRTGRTGHWLNHGKEHCLVGMKGNPENLNRGLDCDVIVAEVRATSHKPDEIYGIIERLSPSTRKIELFGRPHNVQPNWITLGNQVDGVRLVDPDLIAAFKKRYPDGNCMAPPPPESALT